MNSSPNQADSFSIAGSIIQSLLPEATGADRLCEPTLLDKRFHGSCCSEICRVIRLVIRLN